ncbi:hypothetical protein N1851_031095 [Merluccius polli]|uniref:Uncharacterized protein n=1 Tax=Merluccius polli TaxID=89951 RepID=A0AA47M4H6_MERPO|nr:hypothetical protein N1851_031095 [Merluccius polli]
MQRMLLAHQRSKGSFNNDTLMEPDMEVPGPSSAHSALARSPLRVATDWKDAETPIEAMKQFFDGAREGGKHLPPLQLSLDSGDNDEERDSTLISFYKESRDKSQWAAPFNCRILGDAAVGVGVMRHILSSSISKLNHGFKKNMGNAAVTALFEGQTDHLVPSLSAALLECDLFLMAGRMVGHSAIHGGPTLSGLSPAVIDALTCGAKEMATAKLCLEDCPEIDHRETISLAPKVSSTVLEFMHGPVENVSSVMSCPQIHVLIYTDCTLIKLLKDEWSEEESVQVANLCLEWYIPGPTKDTNRLLLFQRLLSHSVLGRANAQIKQLRKGWKETGIWPLITGRPDVVPHLFPRQSDVELTPQEVRRVARELRTTQKSVQCLFVQLHQTQWRLVIRGRTLPRPMGGLHASPDLLRQLLKFWTGWEVPVKSLSLQVVKSRGRHHLPTASTCYEFTELTVLCLYNLIL